MRRISFKLFAEGCEKAASRCLKLAKGPGILPLKQTWEQTWEPTGRMPNKPWPVRAGSGKFHYMKATSLYLTLLLQTLQVLMCLRWSQAFRNTLSTLRKRHMLAPADAFFSILHLQLCNTHAPTISISIHLSHDTIIIFLSYMAFLNHTQITCVHICVHGTSVLTLPLCHLDVIYICSLHHAHSICPCIFCLLRSKSHKLPQLKSILLHHWLKPRTSLPQGTQVVFAHVHIIIKKSDQS